MGTRSDVAVLLKRDIDALVPEEKRQAWFDGATRHEHAEGFAYVWRDVKWYIDSDENISQLYAWLEDVDVEDFEIIVAYHEYPESDGDDRGGWYANPWNARKDATVSLILDLKTAPIAAEETPTIGSSAMISRPLLLLEIPATAAEEGNLEDGWQDGELHEVYSAREIAAMLRAVIAERDDARAKLARLEQRTKELR